MQAKEFENMKKLIFCSFMICGLTLILNCSDQSRNGEKLTQKQPDTVYTEETILNTYGKDPEKALSLLDSAKLLGNITEYREQFLKTLIYSNTIEGQHLDSAMTIAVALLEHDSVKENPQEKVNILNILVNISRRRKDDEHYLFWASEQAKYCREAGLTTDALRMDAEISLALTHVGRTEEGLTQIDKTIEELDTKNSIDRLDALIIAIRRKIAIMKEQGYFQEIIPLAQLIIDRMQDYEKNPKNYAEDSYRLPPSPKDRARYIDFTYTQANGFMAEAYALLKEPEKAKKYLKMVEQSNYGKTLSLRKTMIPVYYAVGDYDKMIQLFDESEQIMGNDTINLDYVSFLRYRAMLAEKSSKYKEAGDYWKRYSLLNQQLNDSLLNGEAQKYAAQYRQHEQQLELERQESVIARMNVIIMAIVIIAILAIFFSIYVFFQHKILGKKNSVLVKQIQEAVKFKQEYEELKKKNERTPQEEDSTAKEKDEKVVNFEEMTNQELYIFLSENIIREKLFLNPLFDRQSLIEQFHLSEKQIGAAFSKGSEYGSLPGFIREQRLLYACNLLLEKPELTIYEICMASGFSNHSRFSYDFKKRFSISPTDYRLIASEDKETELDAD